MLSAGRADPLTALAQRLQYRAKIEWIRVAPRGQSRKVISPMLPNQILIATSDRFLKKEYELALRRSGYYVATAETAIECVERIRDFRPELVVLDADLKWGGADGVMDVLESELQELAVPILLLTPRLNRQVLYQLSRFSITYYHAKPLPGRDLVRRVQELLSYRPREKTPDHSSSRDKPGMAS
jgi:DNA-binding response OmpR family regulator